MAIEETRIEQVRYRANADCTQFVFNFGGVVAWTFSSYPIIAYFFHHAMAYS